MVDRTLKRLFHVNESRNCPDCGRRMIRVHRTRGDRVLSILIPVIRCECCGRSRLVMPEDGRFELKIVSRNSTA